MPKVKGSRLNRETGKYELPGGEPLERIDPPAFAEEPVSDPEFRARAAEAGLIDEPEPEEAATSDGKPRPNRPPRKGLKDFSGVEDLLYSIHFHLAVMTKVQEWEISHEKAKALCDATARVARHYNVPDLPQKTVDWCRLIIVVVSVYGPITLKYRQVWAAPTASGKAAKDSGVLPTGQAPPNPKGNGEKGPQVFPPDQAVFPTDNIVGPDGFPIPPTGSEGIR